MFISTDPLSPDFGHLRTRLNELKEELNLITSRLDKNEEPREKNPSTGIVTEGIVKEPFPRIDFGAIESSGKDIRALTNIKEESLHWNEIETQVALLPPSDEEILKSLTGSFTVEITNLLRVDLVQPEYITQVENNVTALDLPETIDAGTRVTLKASPKLVGTNILLAYTIRGANMRIVLSFAHEGHIATALAPTELAFLRLTFFSFINDEMTMVNQISDRKWVDYAKFLQNIISGDEASILLRNQNILVGIKLAYTSVPTVQIKLVHPQELGVIDGGDGATQPLLDLIRNPPIASGKTAFWKTDGILEHVLETYGVVLEITNLLNVALTRPISHLTSGQNFLMPKSINKHSKDVLISIIHHAGLDSGGVMSFRIGSTDLLLAIAFQLFNNGNRFAAAFVPLGVATDRSLLAYLTSNNQWKTSPDQKFGQASEGELVVEIRNIRARVSMTNCLKAVVNVIIKTF